MDPATTAAVIAQTAPVVAQGVVLVGSIAAILVGGELFTTGVEWLSETFGLTESSAGSLVAALATTLPETLIPVLAILGGSGASIGLGAILGGPVTLTTFGLAVLGAAAIVATIRGSRGRTIHVDGEQTGRDLRVFLVGFALAAAAGFLRSDVASLAIAALLVGLYGRYLHVVVGPDENGGDADFDPESLELGRIREWTDGIFGAESGAHRTDPSRRLVLAQVALAAGLLLGGAHLFVESMNWLATAVFAVPETVVAVLFAPLVSNVPENVDGAIWMAEGEDGLAVEQMTGTLAFQGTVVVALGVGFTPWTLSVTPGTTEFLVALAVAIALCTGAAFDGLLRVSDGRLRPTVLVGFGAFYVLFLAVTVYYVLTGAV